MDAVILTAGMGKRLFPYTQHTPKSLIVIGGMTILERQVFHLRRLGVGKIHVVIGHGADHVRRLLGTAADIHYILNEEYSTTNVIGSLILALPYLTDDFFCFCGDCVFDGAVLNRLALSPHPISLATTIKNEYDDQAMRVSLYGSKVTQISKRLTTRETDAEFIGLAIIRKIVLAAFKQQVLLKIAVEGKNFFFGDAVDCVIQNLDIYTHAVDMTEEKWCEVDYVEDLAKARKLFETETLCSV